MAPFRVLVCLAFAAFAAAPASSQGGIHVSSCTEDIHIDATKKNAIDAGAAKLVERLLGSDPSSAFDLLSKEGQANVTREQLSSQAGYVRQFEPKNVTLQHTYLVKLKGDSPGRLVCGTDLSKPDGWESVRAASVPEQAYVLMVADTRNNKLAFTIWLVPDQGDWKAQSFSMNFSSLAEKDPMQLWSLARAQQAQGHNFNAILLYAAAAQTADRGPNFQMGITQSISEEMSKLAVPREIQGKPPFSWKSGETTYKVMNVGPIAVGGKLYVMIAHEVSTWQSEDQVDGWNKQLLTYFKHGFPEYSDVFAGLVARALERGSNRGFGTVEELPALK